MENRQLGMSEFITIKYLEKMMENMFPEPQCTCKEDSKQRALCPICDKEEYDKMKSFSERQKEVSPEFQSALDKTQARLFSDKPTKL